MSDDRADRLSKRRNRSQPQDPDSSDAASSARGSDRDLDHDTSTGASSDVTVKEALQGVYLYLEPGQKQRLDRAYNRLKADYEFEYDESLGKNRHFYRVFAELGLERLENMESSELKTRLENLEDLESLER